MMVRLATRRSPLAQLQARDVQRRLGELGITAELVTLDTAGDVNRDAPLSTMGGQGVFAVEIQRALLRGDADVAVHSAKDLPSLTPDGLCLGAIVERRDPRDVLVGRPLAGLGPGATVATGSPRRRALLLERRPDLHVVELRGNMASRLARVGVEGVDAIVAAASALERLELTDSVAEFLDPTWFVPQVGQGAIALERRSDDDTTAQIIGALNDADAATCVAAERAFLRELGAGCSIPVGAHAQIVAGTIHVRGVMLSPDGGTSVRDERHGNNPEELGTALARELRDTRGGGQLVTT